MSSKNIVAIDIGYGNTKLAWSLRTGSAGEFIFSSQTRKIFESIASIEGMGELDRVQVSIGNQKYLVGPDMAGDGTHQLHGDYANSEVYEALIVGAIHYLFKIEGVLMDSIDVLILGLPVSTFSQKKDTLVHRFNKNYMFQAPRVLNQV